MLHSQCRIVIGVRSLTQFRDRIRGFNCQGGVCLLYYTPFAFWTIGLPVGHFFAPRGSGTHRSRSPLEVVTFVARVRPPGRISEVNVVVDEFTQSQVLGEGDRKEQPSIGRPSR